MKYIKGEGYYLCQGNPRVQYKDYVITADEVQYFEKDDKAIFHGSVTVIQGKNKMVGYEMTANLKTDEFVMDGDVFIHYIRKSKNKDKDAKSEEDVIELRAHHVVYKSGDNDHLIATGDVTMEVDEDTIKSQYLEYKGGEEIVIARDKVDVTGKDDEKLNTDEFIYRIEGEKEGFDAIGGVQLEFTIDDEEDTEEDQSNTGKPEDAQGSDTNTQPTTPGNNQNPPDKPGN